MKSEFMNILDTSIENKIKVFITTNPSENKFKHFFDGIMDGLYSLNDLSKITYWQNIKKNILRSMTEIPKLIESLKKDFDVMDKLPETPTKITLKDKITISISKINEIIPTMALYQIGDFHEYLHFLTDIEKKLKSKPKNNDEQNRLIILDKFTTKNVVIFRNEMLKIGRESVINDINLKSEWVSSSHCTLDFQKGVLIDNNSTNGTKVKESYGANVGNYEVNPPLPPFKKGGVDVGFKKGEDNSLFDKHYKSIQYS